MHWVSGMRNRTTKTATIGTRNRWLALAVRQPDDPGLAGRAARAADVRGGAARVADVSAAGVVAVAVRAMGTHSGEVRAGGARRRAPPAGDQELASFGSRAAAASCGVTVPLTICWIWATASTLRTSSDRVHAIMGR